MAHGLGLGEAGQPDLARALEAAKTLRERLRLVEIDAGRVGAADLEDQRLLLLERAVAGEGRVLGGARVIGAGRAALAVQHVSLSRKWREPLSRRERGRGEGPPSPQKAGAAAPAPAPPRMAGPSPGRLRRLDLSRPG